MFGHASVQRSVKSRETVGTERVKIGWDGHGLTDGWLVGWMTRVPDGCRVLVGSRQWVLQKLLTDGEKNTCSVCPAPPTLSPNCQLLDTGYRLFLTSSRGIPSSPRFSDPCSSCVLEKYLSMPGLLGPTIAMMMFIYLGTMWSMTPLGYASNA